MKIMITKIIAISTFLAMLVSMLMLGVFAVANPTIVASNVSGNIGDTVDVTISLKDNPGVVTVALKVEYDSNLLLTNVTDSGLLPGQYHQDYFANPYYLTWVNDAEKSNYTVNGVLVTLSFQIKNTAVAGQKYDVKVSYDLDNLDIYNVDVNPVSFSVQNGSVTVNKNAATLSSVSLKTKPTKTNYYVGETLNVSGLTLTAKYSDNTEKTITSGFTTSGFNSSTVGTKTVTVSYMGKTTTFTVTVNQKPTPPATETKIFMNAVKGRSGEEVNVTFEIEKNPGLAYLKLNVDYDTSVLELVSATNSGLLLGTFLPSQLISEKPYTLQWMNADNSTGNGNFVTLKFKIKDGAAEGDYTVTVQVVEAYNETFDEVAVTTANGTITVKNYIVGDLNDDGVINGKDGILCAQVLADWDVAYNADAADVNGDGVINGKDGILLAQYLADWDVTLG